MPYALQTRNLPRVSRKYFHFSAIVANRRHSTEPMAIAGVEKGPQDQKLIWLPPQEGQEPLSGLELLIILSGIGNFRGANEQDSKDNAGIAAAIGAVATGDIYHRSIGRARLSRNSLDFIHSQLVVVHNGIVDAFQPDMTQTRSDRQAFSHLAAAGRILGQEPN